MRVSLSHFQHSIEEVVQQCRRRKPLWLPLVTPLVVEVMVKTKVIMD